MSDQLTIEAELIPPQKAGLVLLTGAAELIMEALGEMDLTIAQFVRDAPIESAHVTCTIRGADPGETDYLKRRVERELAGLVGINEELAGWKWRVSVGESDEEIPEFPGSSLLPIVDTLTDLQQDEA